MAQTVYDEVFDGSGKLISSATRVVPDSPPTSEQRIAALEAQLSEVHATLAAVGSAGSFDAAKVEIQARIDVGKIVLPADGELVEAVR